MLAIARQLPKLLRTIQREHTWLQQVIAEHAIDAVISDNRYGLYSNNIPTVIMTHQLQVLSGKGKTADNLLRKIHYNYLERFGEIWVVDDHNSPGLAGIMSHPVTLPRNAHYIGLLSQQKKTEPKGAGYLLVLLSGPEPQRTLLSRMLWKQVQGYNGKVVFVEGSTTSAKPGDIPPHINHYLQLTRQELSPMLSGAELVICRSGYSTIMDLVKLNKKAILIPTPGQTEQEYLAETLQAQGRFISKPQNRFDLQQALIDVRNIQLTNNNYASLFEQYKQILDNWLQ